MIDLKDSFYNQVLEKNESVLKNRKDEDERNLRRLIETIDVSFQYYMCYYTIYRVDYMGDAFYDFSADVFMNTLDYSMAIIELNKRGMYVQARSLFRCIYESLVILKYSAIAKKSSLIIKYLNGKRISLLRDVFSKINPSMKTENLRVLWDDLCRFSHFSTESLSLETDQQVVSTLIEMNYEISYMMLYMNYHVMNSYCFSSSMKAKLDRLIDDNDQDGPKAVKKNCKIYFDDLKRSMPELNKRVVYEFSRKWKLK